LKLIICCTAVCIGIASFFYATSKNVLNIASVKTKPTSSIAPKAKIVIPKNTVKIQANKIASYAKLNGYNTEYCFLIDMKIPSGKKRFYIYNLIADSIEHTGLVTHGGGSGAYDEALTFSNIPNSAATSLGKYKIGVEYSGKFGMAFKLLGLDKTNSKAFERFVVLHGHSCVPSYEIYPEGICTSLGCPTVNPNFLNTLKKYIDNSAKPMLLWIYKY
jgi:hypothetical protein